MGFFDLTKEEQFTTNHDDVGSAEEVTFEYGLNPVDDFLMDCNIADMGSNIEKMSNELVLLTKVDNGCARLEENLKNSSITFESALNEFKDSIDGSGFTLESFGLNDENLTVESAVLTFESGESRLTKIWNWIKNKIQAIKNWFAKLWNTIFGKSKKLDKIADELEKQIEAIPEGGFTSESALTHESGTAIGTLYYKEIKNIPDAFAYVDILASIKKMGEIMKHSVDPKIVFSIVKKELEKTGNDKATVKSNIINEIKKTLRSLNPYRDIFVEYTNLTPTKDNTVLFKHRNMQNETIVFGSINIIKEDSTNLFDTFDFTYDMAGKVTKRISDNTELRILNKKSLIDIIKMFRTIKKLVDDEVKLVNNAINVDFSDIEKIVKSRSNNNSSDDLSLADYSDIVNFLNKFSVHVNNSINSGLVTIESLLRILAIHVKKHYQNQHSTK